jgi:SAM-dependent methyltransferase
MGDGIMKNDWKTKTLQKFVSFEPPLKEKLYNTVANYINKNIDKKVLDFGCGDGNQVKYLDASINIFLHDINKNFVDRTLNKYSKKFKLNAIDIENIEFSSSFDSIIFNMVWMCLSSEKEVDETLNILHKLIRKDGFLYVSITNPYSRNMNYSYYYTDYFLGRDFSYEKNGEPFEVYIKDTEKSSFKDFHWTLEYTINKLIEFGFFIVKVDEISDVPFEGFANNLIPPYLLLILKK